MEDGPESQEISASKMGEDCWASIFLWFREYTKARHAGKSDRKRRDEAPTKNESHDGRDKENQSEEKNGGEQQVVGQRTISCTQ